MFKKALTFSILVFMCACAQAEITIQNAWVRGTVEQQKATGAFMQIKSTTLVHLIKVSSPNIPTIQIHEMKMEGDMMKMREIKTLAIPADEVLELKPGAYHIMLMGLNTQLKEGTEVPLVLTFQNADKTMQTVEVKAGVWPLTASAKSTSMYPK